jgi:hypothetical protein
MQNVDKGKMMRKMVVTVYNQATFVERGRSIGAQKRVESQVDCVDMRTGLRGRTVGVWRSRLVLFH